MLNDVFYGSRAGGWVYAPVDADLLWPVTLGLLVAAGAVFFAWASRRFIDRWPVMVVLVWVLGGTATQRLMRELAPYPDDTVIGTHHDPFSEEARTRAATAFLRDFRGLMPVIHFHVRANLAGKVLFYHALRTVTEDPNELVWLIMGIANLGGVLAYAIVCRLFDDRRAGLAALVFYLFLPSKLYFAPIMNAVTPVFILLPLWLLVRFLSDRRPVWLVLLGVALYWSVLFEPVPLVTGLTFLALMWRAWVRGETDRPDNLLIFTVVPATLLAVNAVVAHFYSYEIISAFSFALGDARDFNRWNYRPYGLWVAQNLIDTLTATGPLVSALFLGIAGAGAWRIVRAARREGRKAAVAVACEPAVCLALSVLASLAVVDLFGINRGETIRLWIFWGVFALLPVAGVCARRPRLFSALLAVAIVQSCVGVATRTFVFPG